MPSLTRLLQVISPLVSDTNEAERIIRRAFASERVYIPPPNPKRDRSAEIRKAAARLPVSVVSERFGVSRSWVYQLVAQSRSAKSPANPRDSG